VARLVESPEAAIACASSASSMSMLVRTAYSPNVYSHPSLYT
jgi:hypothetical protein